MALLYFDLPTFKSNHSMMSDNSETHVLSDELLDKLRYFAQDHDALRVSRSMRTVFFDYVRFQSSGLPVDFDDVMNDIEAAIQIMEVIADETNIFVRNEV